MNTVSHPASKPNPARVKAMKSTHKLLLKLGFKRAPTDRLAQVYVMPEFPGPEFIVSEPLANVYEVITAVYAWGHSEGRNEHRQQVREVLGVSVT